MIEQKVRVALCGVLCVLLCLDFVSAQNFACSFTGSKGSYDLSGITNQIIGAGAQYNYALQMCGVATGTGGWAQYCASQASGSMVCQSAMFQPIAQNTYAAAYPTDQTGKHTWAEVANGVQLIAWGQPAASGCEPSGVRSSEITITCDSSVTGPTATLTGLDDSTCVYKFALTHASACAGGNNNDNGGGSSLSGGSVFLIIFFVSLFVYVVAGCFYKRYKKGTTGMVESCPNNEFWMAVPGLVKEGFLYTFHKVKSLCGGGGGSTSSKSSYETI